MTQQQYQLLNQAGEPILCVGKDGKCRKTPRFLIGLYGLLTVNPVCGECKEETRASFSIGIEQILDSKPEELARILGSHYSV